MISQVFIVAIIAKILKILVQIFIGRNIITNRPCEKMKSIGMPSGHSVIAGYMFSYTDNPIKYITLLVPVTRVVMKYHTILQTVIGFTIGIFLSEYIK